MTLIRHEAPTVTNLNLFKVQEEFAAQQAAQKAAQAKQQRSVDEVKRDISADEAKLQGHTDKLNQREVELMNREKALTAQMESFAKRQAEQEKNFAAQLRKHEEASKALDAKMAKLRDALT